MDTFGFLLFPGLLKHKIDRIDEEFEAVFAKHGGGHGGDPHDEKSRSCIVPFIDQSEYLSALIDDPNIEGIFASLLGEDFAYLGSDGNFYVGDTRWHSDGDWSGKMRGKPPRPFYKLAIYLDPLERNTGALRIIPGSHRYGDRFAESLQETLKDSQETLSASGADIPAFALETAPGDVAVFNQLLKHSAWGGNTRRRMFTINCTCRYTDAEIPYLHNEIRGFARFWVKSIYGDAMLRTAGPGRMTHLQQALDHEGCLADAVRAAKAEMNEPSRG